MALSITDEFIRNLHLIGLWKSSLHKVLFFFLCAQQQETFPIPSSFVLTVAVCCSATKDLIPKYFLCTRDKLCISLRWFHGMLSWREYMYWNDWVNWMVDLMLKSFLKKIEKMCSTSHTNLCHPSYVSTNPNS